MWVKILGLWLTFTLALACEMPCRRGVSKNFADYYTPVLQQTFNHLQQRLFQAIQTTHAPHELSPELFKSLETNLANQLNQFVQDDSLKIKLANGFYQVIFNQERPYKGDCNHPKVLDRTMPPPNTNWTMIECEKMNYRCGNPPSICHFLDDVKQRCLKSMRQQLTAYVSTQNGPLLKALIKTTRQSILAHGLTKPIETYMANITAALIRSTENWVLQEVAQICNTPDQEEACSSWDHLIKLEILTWP
ncbi:hypothetical protein BY458DRAFT_439838 [Sporodiniella umbellata]|nr:hypothetical protein BY458DRAFT_439838 [Sporodiniella umbellata]